MVKIRVLEIHREEDVVYASVIQYDKGNNLYLAVSHLIKHAEDISGYTYRDKTNLISQVLDFEFALHVREVEVYLNKDD